MFQAICGKSFDSDDVARNRDVLWADWEQRFQERLTDREKRVVTLRAEGKMLKEIADDIGVTTERVRQIYEKSLKRLRNPYPRYWNPLRK
jgi:RNA polymerase sigma factor (sigma-70 family)